MHKITYILLVGVLCATDVFAQVRVPPLRTKATLGACTDAQPKIVAITDGASDTDLTTGGGAFDVIGFCRDGAWSVTVPGTVLLQGSTPGSQQTGHLNISGTAVVGTQVTTPIVAAPVGSTIALSSTAPSATTGASQAGKAASLTASNAVASTDTDGAAAGGTTTIASGDAARRTSGNATGGDVVVDLGDGIGAGATGAFKIMTGTTLLMSVNSSAASSTNGNFEFNYGTSGANNLKFSRTSGHGWRFNGNDTHFVPQTGNESDIGISGQTIRSGYFGTSVSFGTATTPILYYGGAYTMALKNGTNPETLHIFGTADAHPTLTNYERLSSSCSGAGACTIATETAGTGADNTNLTVKSEGPAGVLTLDGSDDVAGDTTIAANGAITASEGISYIRAISMSVGWQANAGATDGWQQQYAYPHLQGGSTAQACWTSSTPGASVGDVGIGRADVGVFRVTNCSTGIGKLLTAVLVEANTAVAASPNILTVTESGTLLTNEGIAAQNYHTLPLAAAGLCFEFAVQDADGIRIVANTGDTIRIAGNVSAAAGYIQNSTIGSTIRLCALNSTEWFAMGTPAGTWTIDS